MDWERVAALLAHGLALAVRLQCSVVHHELVRLADRAFDAAETLFNLFDAWAAHRSSIVDIGVGVEEQYMRGTSPSATNQRGRSRAVFVAGLDPFPKYSLTTREARLY